MRAFADGCSAITGVEAVSNGVPAFKRPEARHARTTLAIMGVLVGLMFLGTSYLAGVTGAVPTEHETVISQIGRAVFGTGVAYYVLQFSTMGILILAANTSFADFPRLASLLARDGYMPSRFAFRGERLAFSTGIVALAVLSIVVARRVRRARRGAHPAVCDRRLHLDHAVAGRHGRPLVARPRRRAGVEAWSINGGGAVATGDRDDHLRGRQVRARRLADRRHHPDPGRRRCCSSAASTAAGGSRPRSATEIVIGPPQRHQRVIVPASDVTRDVVQAIRFGRTMSDDVSAVHVTDDLEAGERIRDRFERQLPGVPLVIVESPYRSLVRPLVRYLEDAAERSATTSWSCCCPSTCRATGGSASSTTRTAGGSSSALLGHPNVLVAEVPYRRERLRPARESRGAAQPPRTIRRASRVTRRNSVKWRHGRMWLGSPA